MADKIPQQRRIIDRQAVSTRLDAIAADQTLTRQTQRAAVLALLKTTMADGVAVIRRRFEEEGATGAEVVRANSFLMDQLIRVIHDFATQRVFDRVRVAGDTLGIVAVGGYGRGELAPFSDLDLLFLLPYKATPYSEQVVEYILYMLWDLSLKVGHSTRTVDECIRQARLDGTIRTALLEARWLWGDQEMYLTLKKRYRAEVVKGTGIEFVERKLAERDSRHDRLGDARYVLEPNIKDGKGGLRDLHTLFWIVRYLYGVSEIPELVSLGVLTPEAANRFVTVRRFLWTVRCHLHYLTGRPEDRLTFDVQQQIGQRMGYVDTSHARGVERFMRRYYLVAKDVGDLTRILCAVLEEQHKRKPRLSFSVLSFRKRNVDGFVVEGGRLAVPSADTFDRKPMQILRLFHASHVHGIDIHPNTLQRVAQSLRQLGRLRDSPEANRLFLEILTSRKNPVATLRLMNESGVFGRFIPDFGRVVAQMQYDMYHVYTTDEHTLRAIGVLHDLESGALTQEAPLTSQLIHQIQSRRALFVAVLLHDIAKGRGGDHSELGAQVALKLGPRLGLTPEETETVSWLVRNHLTMSRTAFKRDLDDVKTVEDYVRVVQSPERLRLLLIVTCADIRAVGPTAWNGWKAALLRNLYNRAEEAMSGGVAVQIRDRRVQEAKEAVRTALADWPEDEVERHLSRGYPAYWLAFDTATHVRHARMIMAADRAGSPLTIETREDPTRSGTEIIIYTGDHAGLFSQISGAIALVGESIADAKIITMVNGMALDTFWIHGPAGEPRDRAEKMKKIRAAIESVLHGKVWPQGEFRKGRGTVLPSRTRVFQVPPRVIIDNTASKTHTLVEVNGRDRPGLLYDVTSALTALGLQISSAQVATYGERVVDVFYVKDVFGMKVDHEGKLRQVRKQLLDALADPADAHPQEAPSAAE
ncbi:MAG: [protein-PII] uridylyltransferase [Alphaproteobacteria bacterium]